MWNHRIPKTNTGQLLNTNVKLPRRERTLRMTGRRRVGNHRTPQPLLRCPNRRDLHSPHLTSIPQVKIRKSRAPIKIWPGNHRPSSHLSPIAAPQSQLPRPAGTLHLHRANQVRQIPEVLQHPTSRPSLTRLARFGTENRVLTSRHGRRDARKPSEMILPTSMSPNGRVSKTKACVNPLPMVDTQIVCKTTRSSNRS
jgi:hypothetical protein